MTPPSPFRLFLALRLHAPYALILLVLVAAVSVWTVALSPSELDSGLGMVLFLQMFLASSGFLPAARRGHFDPILTAERGRVGVAIAHWIVSIGPGVAAWVAITAAAFACGSPVAPSAVMGHRAAALFIVSAVAWSAGFAFSRGAAGVAWIGVLVLLLVRHVALIPPAATSSLVTVLRQAAILMLCPFLLVGPRPAVAQESIPVAIAAAGTVLIAIWRRTTRIDVPLGSDV